MTTTTLTLHVAGEPRDVNVQELEPTPSQSTGLNRRAVSWSFTLRMDDPLEDSISDQLVAAQRADDGIEDASGVRWLVRTFSTSYSNQGDLIRYDVELLELEDLDVKTITIAGQECEVVWFEDGGNDASEGETVVVTVDFRVPAEALADVERLLWEAPDDEYFDFARTTHEHGVIGPVKARVGGKVRWQRDEANGKRYLVNFVIPPPSGDDPLRNGRPFMGEGPEGVRMRERILRLEAMVEQLLEELLDDGKMTAAGAERVRALKDSDVPDERMRMFYESTDLERYR